ncbi:Sugar transport protein 13 [Zostera marina]|uniref:Sugar transport protein 13 n=1 Tax=Zostera marina TaxID=29655 RepID=A0A0K9PYM1_ZOSMR|nr:Sugar transport protein 13 [Zostera marina]
MELNGKVTHFLVVSCVMAISGGLMFGYDVGITGGVMLMDDFLMKFFPEVYERKSWNPKDLDSIYCKYNDVKLQLFTSFLYLPGVLATLFASHSNREMGRKPTMVIAGVLYLTGLGFTVSAQYLCFLILGRFLSGWGIVMANQTVPIFLSEIAPSEIRHGLNITLTFISVIFGIIIASLVNYGNNQWIKFGWGWRLSLGLGGIPALILIIGCFFILETPNSLIERGCLQESKTVLRRIRGIDDIKEEYDEVYLKTCEKAVEHPYRNLFKRRNRLPLVIVALFQMFQQFTGINVVIFYGPLFFNTLGFGNEGSLISVIIISCVYLIATMISIYHFYDIGRRLLLVQAGVQMLLGLVGIAIILFFKVPDHSSGLGMTYEFLLVVLVCVFVSAFAWSWGALGWWIPPETFPVEASLAAQIFTSCVNLLFTFAIAQASLSMFCYLKFGIFLFFAGWVMVMTAFVIFFLPEMKDYPVAELSNEAWRNHWFWKKFDDENLPPRRRTRRTG